MGVTLPSDLIVDVMRNADPSRLSQAKARLNDLGNGKSDDFQVVLAGIGEREAVPISAALRAESQISAFLAPAEPGNMGKAAETEAHVAFEHMVLRNLLETLLPDAGSGSFGTGPSAGIWRSLAADQLAGLYADSGGIGIAATLSGGADQVNMDQESQWPYFSTDRIEAFAG